MALLLRDREPTSEAAPQPPSDYASVTAPDFACETCGAAMARGQDWCLECGTAAPGRLGARPGWRGAFTVVGLTMLLVVGAVIASYAALTTDAERKAAAPSSGDGAPIAAQAPAVAPPAIAVTPGPTGPGTTPPAVAPLVPNAGTTPPAVTPPAVTPPAAVAPPAVTPPAVTPPAVTPPPAVKNTPPPPPAANTPPPPPATPKAVVVKFKSDAATTYDPAKRAGAEFGPASNAVDKKKNTVWDVIVPADGKPIGAGLLLNLGAPYALRAIKLDTPTKGFNVELYGAVDGKEIPEDILDKRWEHITDVKKVTDGKLVSLLNKSKDKFQQLLLWVTVAGEPTDPRVALENVTVAGTP